MSDYSIPTLIDTLNASQYANVKKMQELMKNPKISDLCKGKNPDCIKFIEDNKYRKWRDIFLESDKSCTKDTDCLNDPTLPSDGYRCLKNELGENKCIFSTLDTKAGKIHINNKELCLQKSNNPIVCNNTTCDTNKDSIYTEWRDNSVLDDVNPELKGKCVLGNFMLKTFAEQPQFRGQNNLSTLDNYKLFYDDNVGKMYMTPEYCDEYDTNFGSGDCSKDSNICPGESQCQKSIDGTYVCEKRMCTTSDISKCLPDERCSTELCHGDGCSSTGVCVNDTATCISKEGIIAQMIIGKTLFALFDSEKVRERCAKKESYDNKNITKNLINIFNNYKSIEKNIDDSYIIDKKIVKKDYAGNGINLYKIKWKNNSGNKEEEIGFISSEIQKKYPQFIKIKNNVKYLIISKEDVKNYKDNNIKKIFVFANGLGNLMK